jgi:hypothetical protein
MSNDRWHCDACQKSVKNHANCIRSHLESKRHAECVETGVPVKVRPAAWVGTAKHYHYYWAKDENQKALIQDIHNNYLPNESIEVIERVVALVRAK